MYIYKSKSAITFKEYKHKIDKLNNDWGFYVDIETNKVINKKIDLFIKNDTEENDEFDEYNENDEFDEYNKHKDDDNIFNSCNKYLFFISISLFILIIF